MPSSSSSRASNTSSTTSSSGRGRLHHHVHRQQPLEQQQRQEHTPPPSVSETDTESTSNSEKTMYRVLYNFNAQTPNELDLRIEETVEILLKEENGWWLARHGYHTGWVPHNYVEEIPNRSPDQSDIERRNGRA